MIEKKKDNKIMEGIKEFVSGCPYLEIYLETLRKEINVEYLEEDAKAYSIESEPINPVVKTYLDGSAVKQFAFVFSSREAYGREVVENLANCGFYEEFADWIEDCNRKGVYPDIGSNKEVTKMVATTTPYVFDTSVSTAKYQIQVNIRYYQKA